MPPVSPLRPSRGFTVIEMLVAVSVLAILVLMLAHLFSNATQIVTSSSKRLDADAQARAFLDRLAIDCAQMVKRPDVDYYLKNSSLPQTGNDQLAFFSEVPGYYPATTEQSPLSLVAYRVAQGNPHVQRLGKGLLWNGAGAPGQAMAFLPLTIPTLWPAAINQDPDAAYEIVGPDIFRLEYCYVLKSAQAPDGTTLPSILSDTPWDTRLTGHTSISGLRDVSAIHLLIAVLDGKSRQQVSPAQLAAVSARFPDFQPGQKTGDLANLWKAAIEQPPAGLARGAVSSIRLYERYFPIVSSTP